MVGVCLLLLLFVCLLLSVVFFLFCTLSTSAHTGPKGTQLACLPCCPPSFLAPPQPTPRQLAPPPPHPTPIKPYCQHTQTSPSLRRREGVLERMSVSVGEREGVCVCVYMCSEFGICAGLGLLEVSFSRHFRPTSSTGHVGAHIMKMIKNAV